MNHVKEILGSAKNTKNICNKKGYIDTCFIDPGIVNCGFRITRYHIAENKIDTLFMDKLQFGKKGKRDNTDYQTWFPDILNNCSDQLYNNDFFISCDVFLIEQQLVKATTEMIRIYQHLYSTAMGVNPDGLILLVEAKMKSQCLGVKGLKSKELKKWAIDKGKEILENRGDDYGLEIIRKCKKKDDVSDTVCYDEVYHTQIIDKCGLI